MERTETRRKVGYRKIGGGSLRLGKRIIKPNQTFEAFPDEIPDAFKDCVVPIDQVVEGQPAGDFKVRERTTAPRPGIASFSLKSKGGGWYDIIEISTNKAMNEKSLRKEAAEKLLKDLN